MESASPSENVLHHRFWSSTTCCILTASPTGYEKSRDVLSQVSAVAPASALIRHVRNLGSVCVQNRCFYNDLKQAETEGRAVANPKTEARR